MRNSLRVAALGLVLCLLAQAFGTPALYLPAVGLVVLAALAELSVWLAARGTTLSREPLRATVQERAPLHLAVRVRGRLGRFRGGELAGSAAEQFTPRRWLNGDRLDFTARPQQRGQHRIPPSVMRYRDPFGICERLVLSSTTEVLVLPRIERVGRTELARLDALGRDGAQRPSGAGAAEVDGLQPYREGAPAARIHWPTVARTGTLVERRLQTETDRLPLIALDLSQPAGAEALEMAVRAAASLTYSLARAGGCSLLLPGELRSHRVSADLGSWPDLHARLALVQGGRAPSWPAAERATTILWITARAVPQVRVARGGRGARYTISPFPVAGRPVLFEVAGCAVQPAGGALHASAA